jgi:ABC-type microcin C transport system permease subunit YejE
MGWVSAMALHFCDHGRHRWAYLLITFLLNLIRSVPQIVGILLGYVVLTLLIRSEILRQQVSQLVAMSLIISMFVFLEVTDLIRERIRHYRKLDFFDAMLCSGVREGRIINLEILWRNSRAHLLHKAIHIFGATVFLLCSVDFIISVGLSTDVSLGNFPPTLGGLLATMDSKQDILAISTVLTDPLSFPDLFFEHLQGISTALTIVFTLLCMYRISSHFVARRRLE